MKKRSFMTILITLTLVISHPVWALEMEMEAEEEASSLHMHGYGELHYNVPSDGGTSKMDLHRMVWGVSYEFNDWISVHTEVDFEHAAQEMELEFAYLDFLASPSFNYRAGLMLMPVGPLNETHEPTLFYSVERPLLQKVIIPTTWQEGGVGIFGSPLEGLRYRVYLVSGLAGEGFTAKDGIRKGRGKGAGGEEKPKTGEELAVVGRLEYHLLAGVDLGTSLYYGEVDQNNKIAGDPSVSIYEFDGRLRMAGLDFQAVYVKIEIDGADNISRATCKEVDTTSTDDLKDPSQPHTFETQCETVGVEMVGWYVELAYHLSHLMGTSWDLVPFIRLSEVNTQDSVPSGSNGDGGDFVASGKNDREVTTYGIAYYPDPQVAVKADFQNFKDAAGGDTDQYNLGIAYMF